MRHRVVAVLMMAAVGLVGVDPVAATGSAAVAFNGESGTFSGASERANASVSAAAAKNGTGGLLLSSTASRSFVRWGTSVVPQGRTHASVRLWVRVLSRGGGQSVDVFTVQNSQGRAHFDFFVNGNNQRFQWDLFRDNTDASSFVVAYGRWYLVEAQVEFAGTEHTAVVRIDGVDQGTIRSSGYNSTVRTFSVGADIAKTHRQHYDDIQVRVGYSPLGWLTP